MNRLEQARRETIVDTGQLTPSDKRELNAAVRRGEIRKWKGYWWPAPGADHGIGPLKTCYGPAEPANNQKT